MFALKGFNKNVLTLLTGTALAQAIPIAISPILTRMYSPQEFGIFALYMSIASVISVVASARYDMAIILPTKNEDAINILSLSILITIMVSLLTFLIVSIWNAEITNFLGTPEISFWLYFIPLSVLLAGLYQVFISWFNRKSRFNLLSSNKILQSSTTASTNILLGMTKVGSGGLIFGGIAGHSVTTFFLGYKFISNERKLFGYLKISKIKQLGRRYISFLKYDVFATLFNTGAQQIPVGIFNILFSATIAGHFYFTQRILQFPVNFLGRALLDAFKVEAIEEFQTTGTSKKIYRSTFKKLVLLSLPCSVLVFVFAIDAFEFFFGSRWRTAGVYAQILVPMLMLRLISSPLSFMLYIGEKQKLNFLSQGFLLILVLLSFLITEDARTVVIFVSIAFSIFYLCQIIISAKIARAI